MGTIEELNKFIKKATSPFHTVDSVCEELKAKGFTELNMAGKWEIQKKGRYYVKVYDSTLMAFTVGENGIAGGDLRVCSAHTDFPCFKLKPDAVINENGYRKINTELYGGAILNTWLDRPLSVAGRVIIKGKGDLEVENRLVDFKRPVMIIPNLAIHLNREVNKGVELNRQKEMLPIADIISKEADKFCLEERLAGLINVKNEDILDYELYIYQCEEGEKIGFDKTMFSSPRLDNLTSVKAAVDGITGAEERESGINMVILYDNEEIGSRTKQGAQSDIILLLFEKIMLSLGKTREDMIDYLINGKMISADVAHGVHPNYPEKSDITNKPMLNGGTVIKIAASQSYANDGVASAFIKLLAKKSKTQCQTFVNRSDMSGGSTLGAITSTILPMRTIDIGVPILAMHSARELMGVNDQKCIKKLLTCFFS